MMATHLRDSLSIAQGQRSRWVPSFSFEYHYLCMARKQFVVHYPDRTQKNISRTERDEQLLSRLIEPAPQPNQYRYIGQTYSCKNFADLSYIREKLCKPVEETGCLPGSWIFQLGEESSREIELRPGELELRLRQQGASLWLREPQVEQKGT